MRRVLAWGLLALLLGTGLVSAQPTTPPVQTPLRRHVAGTWEWPAGVFNSSTATLSANFVFAVPIDLLEPATIDQLAWRVTTGPGATAKLRLGLYAGDGSGSPGALLVDGGEITIASGFTGVVTADVSVQRAVAGRIWFAGISDTALTGVALSTAQRFEMPSLGPPGDVTATSSGFRLAQTYGPLPASLASATRVNAGTSANRPFLGGVRIGSVP